jgi:hypothetical protein
MLREMPSCISPSVLRTADFPPPVARTRRTGSGVERMWAVVLICHGYGIYPWPSTNATFTTLSSVSGRLIDVLVGRMDDMMVKKKRHK